MKPSPLEGAYYPKDVILLPQEPALPSIFLERYVVANFCLDPARLSMASLQVAPHMEAERRETLKDTLKTLKDIPIMAPMCLGRNPPALWKDPLPDGCDLYI